MKRTIEIATEQLERGQQNRRAFSIAKREFNKAFIRWVKENTYCRMCGETQGLTFHHEYERRNGGKVLSSLVDYSLQRIATELLKGFFLCQPCHVKWHRDEFGEEPK